MTRKLRLVAGIAAIVTSAILLAQVGCSHAEDPWAKVEGGNLKVLVSFPPLYCFTKGVADKDAKVLSLLVGVGPHEHQATADDAMLASGADLFFVNGLGLDDFVTKVADISGNKKIKTFKIAELALPDKEGPRLKMHEGDEPGHEGHKHHGVWDPHVWLGIEQSIAMVNTIAAKLKEADAGHAADYDKRAAAYVEKLKQLHTDGNKMLEAKKRPGDKEKIKIIATHESLDYFCESFGLELVGAVMPQPGVEPDPAKMQELESLCIAKHVHVIAVEPQYDRKHAEALQRALKAKGHEFRIIEIDPLETAPPDQLTGGDYYFKVMRRNLENLAKALQ
jgi:ABC-type Zn uptake system ZnuABC Zn-binding protein ZnuA